MGSIGKRLFYWNPNHNPRSFVEKVDFVSCAGWLGGGDERERLGLTGGPELVITNLCVMDFHPETKHMRLKSVHPGVTTEEVQEATGFELLIEDSAVPETAVPTVEQVGLIRDVIDPDGMRLREFGR
jgi:glutaconate CoA-transferase subunit B